MKEKYKYKIFAIIILIIQLLSIFGNFSASFANIKEGDNIVLKGDHECDSLLEYWMKDYKRWSYKIVWYVYYTDPEDGSRYPAFCIEPQKEGVGTGYDSYTTSISRENDNRIWRILNKGYMGSSYQEWNLECDDDFYSATKVALHSLAEGIAPKDKYILGNRSVDGNTVEEIQRRGAKVLEVAQNLYEYGLNGSEVYTSPSISVNKRGDGIVENIQNNSYYVQNYSVTANKYLKSYNIKIDNFPNGTKILDSKNQETSSLSENSFKVAIPTNQIKKDINGTIYINDAKVKTNPIYYCKSSIDKAQSYITYTGGYEVASTNTNMQVKANQSNLQISKIDKETKKPIANVKFKVQDGKGNEIAQVTTDKNGIATLANVNPQVVTIKEISVPEPYVLSNEEKQVELKWKETAKVTFENERKKGNLKIVKVDADNKEIALEGVEFELLDKKGQVVRKLITNKDGIAYVTNLEIGKYTLKETKTKENYNMASDRKIEIKWNETTQQIIENQKKKGKIEVYKIDSENKKIMLENVAFEILDNNKKYVQTIITNKKGYAQTEELPIGNYYIREVKTQDRYILNKEIIPIVVKDKQTTKVSITNNKKKGQIEIYKVDKDNNKIKLEGVEFNVLDNKNNIVDTLKTNKNGYAITKKLPIGEYKLVEIKTNDNYVLNEEPIEVIVKYGRIESLKLENEKIKGQIKILKISEDDNLRNGKPKGSPIANVVFEIKNERGEIVEELITNEEGIAISQKLEKGKYVIKETKTNSDYEINNQEFKIEITENEKIEELTITNLSKKPEKPKLPRTGF